MPMKKVYLDANTVIASGKPPGSPELKRFTDLVKAGWVEVLTTDLTLVEIFMFHAKRDFEEIRKICNPKFRRIVDEATGVQIPDIDEKKLRSELNKKHKSLVVKMFEDMDAEIVGINDVKPVTVFADYKSERGFFANSGGKKHQFPDAFIFECLKKQASKKVQIIIVSKDKDFERPVENQEHISLVRSLPDLFDQLGLKLEDPEIEDFLEQHYELLIDMVADKLSNGWLEGDIEGSEITQIEVYKVEIKETIAFKSAKEWGSILVLGRLLVMTYVDFTFPDESGIFSTIESQNEIDLKIDVSLSITVDDNGEPIEIEELEFRNDNFVNIELDPYGDDWF